MKTISWKKSDSPFEVYEEKYYGENTTEIKVNMSIGDTLTFDLTK